MSLPISPIQRLATDMAAHGREHRHRACMVLSGSRAWGLACVFQALEYRETPEILWLGDESHAPEGASVLGKKGVQWALGREVDALVVDAFTELSPDVLGAVAGTVRAGGLLIFCVPLLEAWPEEQSPLVEMLRVEGFNDADIGRRFITRLANLMATSPEVVLVREGAVLPVLGRSAPPSEYLDMSGGAFCSPEQGHAYEAIRRVAQARRPRPLMLTSGRGRGKSAALGLAAASVLREGPREIVVTAPTSGAIIPVFRHARLGLGLSGEGYSLSTSSGSMRYVPPGFLMDTAPDADIVFVDEAASLPIPLLTQILRRYRRVVFSTTLHGYEGTGQGFALRFTPLLNALAPGWRRVHLDHPARWAPGDPVDSFVSQGLMMNALMTHPPRSVDGAEPEITAANRDALVADEALLQAVFGLLSEAHYRTSPNDLLRMLDGPNVQLYVLKLGGWVAGAVVLNAEGGLGERLSEEIAAGARRPQGHLLPCSLAFHHGLHRAPLLRCGRVVRIAIHPGVRRRGLGRALMRGVMQACASMGADYVGTVFGASPELVEFWGGCGLGPVRLGLKRGKSTGLRSAVMATALSASGAELLGDEGRRLASDLPILLGGVLRDEDPRLGAALLAQCSSYEATFDSRDALLVEAVAWGKRDPDLAAAALWRYVSWGLTAVPVGDGSDLAARARLVEKVLQAHSWGDVSRRWGVSGRPQAVAILRADLAALKDGVQRCG